MPPVRFEPTISAGERPQTYILDRAVTGIVFINYDLDIQELPTLLFFYDLFTGNKQ